MLGLSIKDIRLSKNCPYYKPTSPIERLLKFPFVMLAFVCVLVYYSCLFQAKLSVNTYKSIFLNCHSNVTFQTIA